MTTLTMRYMRGDYVAANAQTVLQLIQLRLVLISEGLNFTTERLDLSFGACRA
jgi:hypothetical protein